jgi:coproporphyrinogen III oxidase
MIFKEQTASIFKAAQHAFCKAIEECEEGKQRFKADIWKRDSSDSQTDDPSQDGGITSVISGGEISQGIIFEKAGVNFSKVAGTLLPEMSERLVSRREELPFFATGISLVIHPFSPHMPTTHANLRYLEVGDEKWFGGGMDLTPYILYEEDACHFHRVLKDVCDKHHLDYYPRFKKWCDQYFYLPHRKEHRGIGGIFFDYIGKDKTDELTSFFNFISDLANELPKTYLPIVKRRKSLAWSEKQKSFQLLRRGRYVEFNLLYDRGTLFGLKTNGRTESILMSLPPEVTWSYNYDHDPSDPDQVRLLSVVKSPKEWL